MSSKNRNPKNESNLLFSNYFCSNLAIKIFAYFGTNFVTIAVPSI